MKLRVINDFKFPSGLEFKKGELFYGQMEYRSSIQDKVLPLAVICNFERGSFLVENKYFEKVID